jgi:hypothetical protein
MQVSAAREWPTLSPTRLAKVALAGNAESVALALDARRRKKLKQRKAERGATKRRVAYPTATNFLVFPSARLPWFILSRWPLSWFGFYPSSPAVGIHSIDWPKTTLS